MPFANWRWLLSWFPPLPSCPGAQTPCAQESLNDALTSLRTLLFGNCPACLTYVFNKPYIVKTGINQRAFYRYLMGVPRLYDGTRSYTSRECSQRRSEKILKSLALLVDLLD